MIDFVKHREFHTENATAAAIVLDATDLGVDAIPEPFRRVAPHGADDFVAPTTLCHNERAAPQFPRATA